MMSQKTGTLKRLQSIKNIMTEKENDSPQMTGMSNKKPRAIISMKRLDKKGT